MEPIREVALALTGPSGALPRRVVVLSDGQVADKTRAPKLAEVAGLSLVCETLRRHLGQPVWSRASGALMHQCLDTDEHGAWKALLDDVNTGDIDVAEVKQALAESHKNMVMAIVRASAGQHFWTVVNVARHILPIIKDESTVRKTAEAFEQLFTHLVTAVSRRATDMSNDERGMAITVLGKLMRFCSLPAQTLANIMADTRLSDDALRIFIYAPLTHMVQLRPTITEMLVIKAERAQQDLRYPSLAILALLPPAALQPYTDRLVKLCQKTLTTAAAQKGVDAKLAVACASVCKAVADRSTMAHSLAHTLLCMSGSIVHQRNLADDRDLAADAT